MKNTSVRLVRFNQLINFLYMDVGLEVYVDASCTLLMMKYFICHNILLGPS